MTGLTDLRGWSHQTVPIPVVGQFRQTIPLWHQGKDLSL